MTTEGDLLTSVQAYLRERGWKEEPPGQAGSMWHRQSLRSPEEIHIAVPDRIVPGTAEWRSVIGCLADYEQESFHEIARKIREQNPAGPDGASPPPEPARPGSHNRTGNRQIIRDETLTILAFAAAVTFFALRNPFAGAAFTSFSLILYLRLLPARPARNQPETEPGTSNAASAANPGTRLPRNDRTTRPAPGTGVSRPCPCPPGTLVTCHRAEDQRAARPPRPNPELPKGGMPRPEPGKGVKPHDNRRQPARPRRGERPSH